MSAFVLLPSPNIQTQFAMFKAIAYKHNTSAKKNVAFLFILQITKKNEKNLLLKASVSN